MTRPLGPRFLGALCWLSLAGAQPAPAGTIPTDLVVSGLSGGLEPWDTNHAVRITADGSGEYARLYAEDIGVPPEQETAFVLTPQEVQQIWDEITVQGFFTLPTFTADTTVAGGSFVQLTVVANADTHRVEVENAFLSGLEAIRLAINSVTPPGADLVYEGPTGAVRGALRGGTPHPGSMAAFCCTLGEGVRDGRVIVTGKGGSLGSIVEIDVNNLADADKPTIKVQVHLEFYCDATEERVAFIENAIESVWNGHMTSGGKMIEMCVVTRFTDAPMPPNTPGFHQIKLSDKETSFVDAVATLNAGVEGGCWRYMGRCLAEMYAHECGHLLGFDDEYEDWRRREDGRWQQHGGVGPILTSAELAAHADPRYPDFTQAQLEAWFDDPKSERVCPPHVGHEHDLMARKTQPLRQEDIDALAANPGFKLSIKPGDVFLNEDDAEQDLVATRAIDVFVPSGQTRTFSDVYAACLDAALPVPAPGTPFDVTPGVSDWNGAPLSGQFQDLLELIDERGLWNDVSAQKAIYWFTDQLIPLDQDALDLLEEIGVDTSRPPAPGFPKLTDPGDNANQTDFEVPTELAFVEIVPFDFPMTFGQKTPLDGAPVTPNGTEATVSGSSWEVLTRPDGSTAQVSDPSGLSTSFTPDHPGFYLLELDVDFADVQPEQRVSYPVTRSRATRIFAADETMETFEAGVLAASGFDWVQTGDVEWDVRAETPHTGTYSLEASGLADGESAIAEVVVELTDSGPIGFARKVSSELNDTLSFYVNDVLLSQAAGESDWTYVTIPLFPGTFTLRWEYVKDGSGAGGADAAWIDDIQFAMVGMPVPADDPAAVAPAARLLQNAPNPFRRATRIGFNLEEPEHVRLSLYDVSGRFVVRVVDRRFDAGRHDVAIDARDLAPGTYFYRLSGSRGFESRRMIVLD